MVASKPPEDEAKAAKPTPPDPLRATDATKIIRAIAREPGGVITVTGYFKKRMAERGIAMSDVTRILRCGTVGEPDLQWERVWRYPVWIPPNEICVELQSETHLTLITCYQRNR